MKVNFYMEPQYLGGTQFYAKNLGGMLNMPCSQMINFFSRTGGQIFIMGLQLIIGCSNDGPRMTLANFMARSVLET